MVNWKHKIYFSDLRRPNVGLAFEDRVAIAERFRQSNWFRDANANGYSDLADYVDELEHIEDAESFAIVMAAIYDEADYGHACFIDTVSPVPGTVPA